MNKKKHKYWSKIIGQSAFSGLIGCFLISMVTDSLFIIALGSLSFTILTGYIFHQESLNKNR